VQWLVPAIPATQGRELPVLTGLGSAGKNSENLSLKKRRENKKKHKGSKKGKR
jgi:hypothetical protein